MRIIRKIKGFFQEKSQQSMMRLCTLILVCSGILITATAVIFSLDGGYYGIELAALGILGKSYQKGVENKKLTN
jgi:hypothetical protein